MNSKPHDILGELFKNDPGSPAVAGLEELNDLIHACLPPGPARSAKPRLLLPLQRKSVSRKKKTTHYLRAEVFDGLTQAKEILKRLLPDGSKSRASKSNLVNYAVKQLLREIEDNGEDSAVIKAIIQKKA